MRPTVVSLSVVGALASAVLAVGSATGSVPLAATAAASTALVAVGTYAVRLLRLAEDLGATGHLALVDELTGLRNRRGFVARLDAMLAGTIAGDDRVALLLLDLDEFKQVNDTLGHHAGDELLGEVARRLQEAAPTADIARLGGDEFVVLLGSGELEALRVAESIRSALAEPVAVQGAEVTTRASIGIAVAPQDGRRRSDLMHHADAAMYRAKRLGSGVERHGASGAAPGRQRNALAVELRQALADEEQIVVHFQPQLDIASGRVLRTEALVRWTHPTRGTLAPAAFLDVAERQGMLTDVTLAVLDRALRQRRTWLRVGIDLGISINIATPDLLTPSFADHVARALDKHDVPVDALTLELDEATGIHTGGRAGAVLGRLSSLGVRLALDDFGLGSTSVTRLGRLDIRELKIDRSFIAALLVDTEAELVVRSTIDVGRSLGLRVVAEGVETAEQLERLRAMGCDAAQGFFLSRALPASRLTFWLMEWMTRSTPSPAVARPATPTGAEK